MFNYSKLLGKIREQGLTQEQVAKEIGKSEATLGAKLKGRGYFNTDEIDGICRVLNIPTESIGTYFFAR